MKGYNFFITEPGEFDVVNCRVCNHVCDVERNKYGPTNWISAMGGFKKLHDDFRCPNSEKDWHDKALKLSQEKDSTESDLIKNILDTEISNLVYANR